MGFTKAKLETEAYEISSKGGERCLFKDRNEFMWACLDGSVQYFIKLAGNGTSFTSCVDVHKCFGHPGEKLCND